MNKKVLALAATITGASVAGGIVVGYKIGSLTNSKIIGVAAGFAVARVIGTTMDATLLRPLLMKEAVDEFNQYANEFGEWFDKQTTGADAVESNPQS